MKLLRKSVWVHFCPSLTLAKTQLKCLKHKGRSQLRDYAKKQKKRTTECKFCSYEHAPKQCPAYGKECRKCGKMNHFQSKCQQHRYVEQVQAAVCSSEWNIVSIHCGG